jgi:hypothetical protein
MAENLIHQLIPHQGCVISRTVDGIDIAGSAMNWVMSAGVAPFAPCAIRVDGDVRFDAQGDYSGIESAPSVGPCFGSTISIRECSITSLA